LEKFPRSQRYGLGRRIETRLYDLLEHFVQAQYSVGATKLEELTGASLSLEVLRLPVRLADEIQLFAHRSHEYAAKEMAEIGKMVGGWMRQLNTAKSTSTA
jgi:hypothetical protein